MGFEFDLVLVFKVVLGVYCCLQGLYVIVLLIVGYGLFVFCDLFGICLFCIGKFEIEYGIEWMVVLELVVVEGIGFEFVCDLELGEVIFIDKVGNFYSQQCVENLMLNLCMFEYVYLVCLDLCFDGVLVYNVCLCMGDYFVEKIKCELLNVLIDVVMLIFDLLCLVVMQVVVKFGVEYCEGFFKNCYVGWIFIMLGQVVCKKLVCQKFNVMSIEFKDKYVLIVDDLIVCGMILYEIVQMVCDVGVKLVIFVLVVLFVKFLNVYGIDMLMCGEFVVYGCIDEEVVKIIGVDYLIYQDVDDLCCVVCDINLKFECFEVLCFDGNYIIGDVMFEYFDVIECVCFMLVLQVDCDMVGDIECLQMNLQLLVE